MYINFLFKKNKGKIMIRDGIFINNSVRKGEGGAIYIDNSENLILF